MIGRGREREILQRLLFRAASSHAGLLTIEGEAGYGKSEFVGYAAHAARNSSPAFLVHAIQGNQFEQTSPLGAVTELVNHCRPDLDRLVLAHRLPLRTLLGDGRSETTELFVLGRALLALLSVAAESRRPLLLTVDDAHWLDAPSAAVLGFALRRLRAEPLVVLIAGRHIPPPLSVNVESIRLDSLDPHESQSLIEDTAGRPVAADVGTRLHRQTRGNPLALGEAVRMLAPDHLDGTLPLPEPLPVGARGRSIVAPVTSRLPPRTRRALVVAAAAGQASRLVLAAALQRLGLTVSDLDPAVAERIIVPGSWTFRHPLFAAVVYDDADPAEVRSAHTVLATLWQGVDASRWAYHMAAAAGGVDAEAAAAMAHAATVEANRCGVAATAQLWQKAVDLSPAGPPRITRLLRAVEAQSLAGLRDTATRNLHEVFGADLSADQLAQATHARTKLLPWSRNVAHEIEVINAACLTLADGDPRLAADAHLNLSIAGFSVGAKDLAMVNARRAADLTEQDTTRNLVAQMVHSFAVALFQGAASYPEIGHLRRPEVVHFLATEMPVVGSGVAHALAWLEEFELSARLRNAVIARARSNGSISLLPYALSGGAETSWWTGRWGDGWVQLHEAFELAVATEQDALAGFTAGMRAQFAAARGESAVLADSLTQADHYAVSLGVVPISLYAARARLHHALARDDTAAAVGIGREAHRLAHRLGMVGVVQVPFLPEYLEAALRTGAPEAPGLLDEMSMKARQSSSKWATAAALRLQALAAGPDATAANCYQESLTLVPIDRMPFEHARTLELYAQFQIVDGDLVAGRRNLRTVLDTYTSLGAEPWRRRAAAALRRIGGRVPAKRSTSTTLSAQQSRVCDLILRGATNREAAAELFLSEKTIEYHLRQAMTRLGAKNRVDLARILNGTQQGGDAPPTR